MQTSIDMRDSLDKVIDAIVENVDEKTFAEVLRVNGNLVSALFPRGYTGSSKSYSLGSSKPHSLGASTSITFREVLPGPLFFAIYQGREDMVRLLLKHGARDAILTADYCVNESGILGYFSEGLQYRCELSAVPFAACLNHTNIVKLLLSSHSYSMKFNNNTAKILSDIGKTISNDEVLKKLLPKNEATQLMIRVLDQKEKIINAIDLANYTELEELLRSTTPSFRWTCDKPASTLFRREETLLGLVALKNDVKILNMLLAAGAKATDDECLHAAARCGSAQIIEILLKNGAEINQLNHSGESPLFVALLFEKEQAAERLIRGGADIHARLKRFLDLAVKGGFASIIKLFLQQLGSDARHVAMNQVDHFGLTPLHRAAATGNIELTTVLMDAADDVNKADSKGMTPLHYAAKDGHTAVVELLIRLKADVLARTKEGNIPAYFAAIGGHAEIVDILTRHGSFPLTDAIRSFVDATVSVASSYRFDSNNSLGVQYKATTESLGKSLDRFATALQLLQANQISAQTRISGIQAQLQMKERESQEEITRLKAEHQRNLISLIASNPDTLHRLVQSGEMATLTVLLDHLTRRSSIDTNNFEVLRETSSGAAIVHLNTPLARIPFDSSVEKKQRVEVKESADKVEYKASAIATIPIVEDSAADKKRQQDAKARTDRVEDKVLLLKAIDCDLQAISFIHLAERLPIDQQKQLRDLGAIFTLAELESDIQKYLAQPSSTEIQRYAKQLHLDITLLLERWRKDKLDNTSVTKSLDQAALELLHNVLKSKSSSQLELQQECVKLLQKWKKGELNQSEQSHLNNELTKKWTEYQVKLGQIFDSLFRVTQLEQALLKLGIALPDQSAMAVRVPKIEASDQTLQIEGEQPGAPVLHGLGLMPKSGSAAASPAVVGEKVKKLEFST